MGYNYGDKYGTSLPLALTSQFPYTFLCMPLKPSPDSNDKFDPLTGDLIPESSASKEQPPETPQIDPTDLNAVRAATWAWLVKTLSVMPPGAAGLPIAREIIDRLDGKAAQRVHVDATLRHVTVNATIRFADDPLSISGNGNVTTIEHDDKSTG